MDLDDYEYTKEDLPELDRRAQQQSKYEEWMMSAQRKHIAGPNHHVRVVNWKNIDEVCYKAGLDVHEVSKAYREALDTGDVIFITYDEVS